MTSGAVKSICRLDAVPEGRPTIAQRFIAGFMAIKSSKPCRAKEIARGMKVFFRPFRDLFPSRFKPSVETLGYYLSLFRAGI